MSSFAESWPFLVAGGLAALPALMVAARVQRLEALNHLDHQTGLRNGRLLDDDVALLSRARAPIALLLVDLDNFRQFNQTSYANGDRALLTAAQTMKRPLQRLGDRVYRKYASGDEFLVLLSPKGFEDAHHQAERIRVALEQVGVPASIGIAYCHGEPGRRAVFPGDLIERATLAKNEAKRLGGNTVYPQLPKQPPLPPIPPAIPVECETEITTAQLVSVTP